MSIITKDPVSVSLGELVLQIRGTNRDGQIVRIRSEKCTIGSSSRCTLRLRGRGTQSLHCLILRGTAATIVRCWSADTRLNGRAFSEAKLQTEDQLSIGSIEFKVVSLNALPEEHPTPSGKETPSNGSLSTHDSASHEHIEQIERLKKRVALTQRQAHHRMRQLIDQLRITRDEVAQLREKKSLQSVEEQFGEREQCLKKKAEELAVQNKDIEARWKDFHLARERWDAEKNEIDDDHRNQSDQIALYRNELNSIREQLGEERRQFEIERDECDLPRMTAQIQSREAAFEARQQELVLQREQLEAERAEAENELQKKADELQSREDDFETRLQELENKKREQLEQREAERAEAENELQKKADELQSREDDFETRLQELENKKREQLEQREAERAEAENMPQRAADLEARQQELVLQREQMETERAEIENELQQKADELQSREDDFETRLQELENKKREQLEQREAERAEAENMPQRAADLEARQQEILQQQREQLEAERAEAENELQQKADELQSREDDFETRLQELENNKREQLEQLEAERAEIENELQQKADELQSREDDFEARLQKLEKERPSEEMREEDDSTQVEQDSTSQEVAFESVASDSPVSTQSVLEQMGVMPPSNEDEEEHETPSDFPEERGGVSGQDDNITDVSTPQDTHASKASEESEPEDEQESINDYMARLLERVQQESNRPSSTIQTEPTAPTAQPESIPRPSPIDPPKSTIPNPESVPNPPTSMPQSEPSEEPESAPQESVEMSPRAVAPERSLDMKAMREVANISASTAIDTHSQRVLDETIFAKMLVMCVGLACGFGLLFLWWLDTSNLMALVSGLTAIVVALLWGIQYLGLLKQIVLGKFSKRQ